MSRTQRLNENLEREAIVMRIITIVTLIYLPATFVSVSRNVEKANYHKYLTIQPDFLQYRCRQVSKLRRRKAWTWYVFVHSDDKMAPSDAAFNMCDNVCSLGDVQKCNKSTC
jgi:hypothetical protein